MAKVICFVNQKGGVAKTTTSLTVGKEMARRGKKILLVDMDPQASLSLVLGVQRGKNDLALQDFIGGIAGAVPAEFEKVVAHLDTVDLLPSNILLGGFEQLMQTMDNNANIFSRRLQRCKESYDYVIIDCPPSLGLLMKNAVMSSDYIVVPVKPEVVSLMGFDQLVGILLRLSESYEKEFDIAGLLLTMCNKRTTAFKQAYEYAVERAAELNTKVFDAAIRTSVQCSNLIGGGENVIERLGTSGVAQDYKEFVDELLKTIEGEKNNG